MKRRELLVGASAAAGGTLAASGPTAAQGGIDYGGWFSDVSNFDGTTVDMTGQSEVTVDVGVEGNTNFFAYGPPAVQVDPGTTVVWEWTGQGGSHNVLQEGGDRFGSDLLAEEGATYEFTFEDEGIYRYYCQPHLGLGMKGAVVVGQPQQQAGGGGGEGGEGGGGETSPEEMGVPFQAHFVGLATILGMVVSLVFAFFVLKYGESAHSSSPERK